MHAEVWIETYLFLGAPLRKDHRPYLIKRLYLSIQRFYTDHFLRPQFEYLGKGHTFMQPRHVELFGAPIELGDYATVIATPDNKIRLSVWCDGAIQGHIRVGKYGLICPGVRISSASGVDIGDNCMLASRVYITDSDWHDIYNRLAFGKTDPIRIEDNVWIGDSAIVCKGVTIGENSIIGAGAVVLSSIPSNVIAAGNPAKVVKRLDPAQKITPRAQWFSDPDKLFSDIDILDRAMLKGNTVRNWVRYLIFPTQSD